MKYARNMVGPRINKENKFENPKGLIKSRESKKKQYNGPQKKNKQWFGALKSDSTHHFFRNTCTKSGSLRFSQFSGC